MTTADRRATLRETLIDLARGQIEREGVESLKARALAQQAECSVGSIYNVFGDMRDLVMAVNGQTFLALGQEVTDRVAGEAGATPTDRMIAMAEGYLSFAAANPRLWQALFATELTHATDVPEWYLTALDNLFAIIDAPLREVFPNLSDEKIRIRTRALFSSIHGIVLLGIEQRISAVEEDHLSEMIQFILTSIADSTEK
ncbi:MAG: TetR/AcrR family transcriptional regulator [Pseudomonadota bacterium]